MVIPRVTASISLLKHVSPIEWDNVVLYGPYVLNTYNCRGFLRRYEAVSHGSGLYPFP